MKCSIQGCTGQYESKRIVHTIHRGTNIFVCQNVPAEVCSVCGDTVLAPDTIKHLETLLHRKDRPVRSVPLYEYA